MSACIFPFSDSTWDLQCVFELFFVDEHSREPVYSNRASEEDDQPIEPYSDIGIDQINELMFKDWK